MATSPEFEDRFWTSLDGLELHYRDYPGPADKPLLLCVPGLTRNARDFEPVIERFAGERRIICAELRGRGESEYAKDSATYNVAQYVADVEALIEQAEIGDFIAIGTSLGGIITMLLAMRGTARIKGALLNDIGPVVEKAGLERISEYVGQGRSFPTWMHAARWLRELNLACYPDFSLNDWLTYTKRLMKVGESGRIRFDYDMRIAEPMDEEEGPAPPPDLWPAYMALAGKPVVVLRGELSDILSAVTAQKMASDLEGAELVTIPRTGHAPTLDEAASLDAIARLLARTA